MSEEVVDQLEAAIEAGSTDVMVEIVADGDRPLRAHVSATLDEREPDEDTLILNVKEVAALHDLFGRTLAAMKATPDGPASPPEGLREFCERRIGEIDTERRADLLSINGAFMADAEIHAYQEVLRVLGSGPASPVPAYDPALECCCGHAAHWHGQEIGAPEGSGECEFHGDCGCKRFLLTRPLDGSKPASPVLGDEERERLHWIALAIEVAASEGNLHPDFAARDGRFLRKLAGDDR